MKNASKARALVMCLTPGVSHTWRTIFFGSTAGLAHHAQELLRQQIQLLETTRALSGAALEDYEMRSKQIDELVRLLAEN